MPCCTAGFQLVCLFLQASPEQAAHSAKRRFLNRLDASFKASSSLHSAGLLALRASNLLASSCSWHSSDSAADNSCVYSVSDSLGPQTSCFVLLVPASALLAPCLAASFTPAKLSLQIDAITPCKSLPSPGRQLMRLFLLFGSAILLLRCACSCLRLARVMSCRKLLVISSLMRSPLLSAGSADIHVYRWIHMQLLDILFISIYS